jgi:two-component system, cell cycle response regulator DivK
MAIAVSAANILVVEDNADNLFIVTDLLQAEVRPRYVNARASGRQLFKLVESNPSLRPHLILLDLQIPYEDGYTILRQIRANPRFDGAMVIALTANIMPADVQRCRLSGFDGFIGKPVDADRFPAQIQRILTGEPVWEPA